MKVPVYVIFCKVCKKDRTYDLDLENDLIGGSNTDTNPEHNDIAHLMLNCHRCNDYSVFVGKRHGVWDTYRYESEKTKKNLDMPIRFAFGWRYE